VPRVNFSERGKKEKEKKKIKSPKLRGRNNNVT